MWFDPCTITIVGLVRRLGIRKRAYIWLTRMSPGGAGPVRSDAPGYSEWDELV